MRVWGRGFLIVGLGALATASIDAPVHAQSVYDALFGTPPWKRSAPGFGPAAPAVQPFFPVEEAPVRRAPDDVTRSRSVPFTPPPVMPVHAKPARVKSDREIVADLMNDPTLERGDIVVFPDGPRVFTGRGGSHRSARDFEDLEQSRLVASKTRKSILAATHSVEHPITVAAAPEVAVKEVRKKRRPAITDDVVATGSIP
jgi:hypothetical protein